MSSNLNKKRKGNESVLTKPSPNEKIAKEFTEFKGRVSIFTGTVSSLCNTFKEKLVSTKTNDGGISDHKNKAVNKLSDRIKKVFGTKTPGPQKNQTSTDLLDLDLMKLKKRVDWIWRF
jgi:hypothetical protein